ncbi:hypothetical protein [Enterococcus phage phiNASRA1]|nr:hypothetical protein [Enterococcus phage phiNASRA1]
MSKNMNSLTALLMGGLVAIFTVVFTGSTDVVGPTLGSTFSLVFVILIMSDDNKEDN